MRVYEGYLSLEERYPERVIGIDAKHTIYEIAEIIDEKVRVLLNDIR